MKKTELNTEVDFKALFESAPSLFLVLKPDAPRFTILAVSDAYLEATMTQRNKITGKGLFEVFPDNPDDPTADGTSNLRKSLEEVLNKRAPHKMAMQKYDIPKPPEKGGGFEERYWSPFNSPVFKKKNKVECIIHRVEDVTEMVLSAKQTQNFKTELDEKILHIKANDKKINEILEALLRYTVRDFSQQIEVGDEGDELDAIAVGLNTLSEELKEHIDLIEHTNNDLETANKELDSFTYSVSHDLRAPLRAIHSYTRILEEDYFGKFDEEGKKTIEVILRNSKRMGELIDDLLAFSRLGRKEINVSDINMTALARNVLDDFITEENKNRVDISFNNIPPASGDPALIKQVWINLISNAFKYSSKRSEINVEIGSYERGNENVFYVKDNGVGFDMRYYNKLFGVFQRLHSQDEFDGTGVGLAIIQRIIKKHHGEVWAESKLNEGSTFYFSLPVITF